MARKPRIHFAGAFYHVMLRGNGGNDIFFDSEDRKKFLMLLSECVNRFNCRVHAYCLMSNHVHLAIQVGEIHLSEIIQNISFRYTRMMNKKRNKIGHLFQGRYKAILVDADNYLLRLIQYIHLNPVRANIVKNLEDYLWSSHNAYLGTDIDWLTTSHVLKYFSQDSVRATSLYNQFVTGDTPRDEIVNFSISNKKSFPAICDDAFMKNLEILQNYQIKKTEITLNEIINFVCEFYQVNELQLHEKSHVRFNAKVRAVIAAMAKKLNVATASCVAAHFNRDLSNISRMLNRVTSHLKNELREVEKFIRTANTQA